MKIILVLVLFINNTKMELLTEAYPSQATCEEQVLLIKKDAKFINDNLYPLEVISASCVPEVEDAKY